MAPYHPPTGGRMGKLRLDFNENTVGASPRVVQALRECITGEGLTVYPEYSETRAALARHFAVDDSEFILTNGTDEAIQVMINTFVDDNQEVLTLAPSYAMYRFYSELAGARVIELPYRQPDLSFPLEELLAAITPNTRAILIANPNNPTGTGVDVPGILCILESAPHAAVLIDEAYFEFCGVTVLPLLHQYPNLFVSRTFSKVYGMAALRVGCLFSQAANVKFMHKAQSPYSVNWIAAVAARAAVEDTAYVDAYVKQVLAARSQVCAGLSKLGIEYFPSQANFVLFRAGSRAIEIRDTLRSAGVLIRDRSYEIAGCVRVTIGTQAQAARFLQELEKIW
jgi:histidinol-phosphate aminotransferase